MTRSMEPTSCYADAMHHSLILGHGGVHAILPFAS